MIHSRMHGIVHFHFTYSYSREGAHWYVSDALGKKTYQYLKAKTKDQFQRCPPPVGWKFWDGRTWRKDTGLRTTDERLSDCNSILVALTGKAKENHLGCEGRYFAVKGLRCRGKQVFLA